MSSSIFLWDTIWIGLKTVGNGRENTVTIPAPALYDRERESRTGKRIRYYGISGTEYFDRERVDYDRESITQKREHRYTCNHLKQLAQRNNCNHALKHIWMKATQNEATTHSTSQFTGNEARQPHTCNGTTQNAQPQVQHSTHSQSHRQETMRQPTGPTLNSQVQVQIKNKTCPAAKCQQPNTQ